MNHAVRRIAIRSFLVTCTLLAAGAFAPAAAEARPQPLSPPPPPPAAPIGSEITIAGGVAFATDPASLAMLADGRWVAAWKGDDGGLYARLYSAADVPLGPAFAVGPVHGTLSSQGAGPAAVTLFGERWAVAWSEAPCAGCREDVFFSLYDGGVPVLVREPVSDGEGSHRHPLLAADGIQRFTVAWTTANPVEPPLVDGLNYSDVHARVFDFSGARKTDVFEVNEDEYDVQNLGGVAYLPAGDLVFVWESYEGEGYFYDVFQRRFSRKGTPLAGEVRVNRDLGREVTQYEPVVTALDFGYLVAWTDWYRAPLVDPDQAFNGTVVARFYEFDGTPIGDEFEVSQTQPSGDRHQPAVASAPDGSFVVLWSHGCSFETCEDVASPDGSRSAVRAVSFGPFFGFGNVSEELLVPLSPLGEQIQPVVRPAGEGGYLALWTSQVEGGPVRLVGRRFGQSFCAGLCLDHGRFQVTVDWQDFQGGRGSGQAVARDEDWGTFWFFDAANVELAVKVLDGTAINGHHWVFFASLSNVAYAIEVRDLVSGQSRTYVNPAGTFASRGDTSAIPLPIPAAASLAAPAPAVLAPAPPVPRARAVGDLTLAACAPEEVCLQGDRFKVEVEWEDFFGASGAGVGQELSADSGWFWFFRSGNPEVLVKVLDARGVNGRYWVFYAALSNVAFRLRVTDRQTGETRLYESPLGDFASAGDTDAFPAL